ncbi:Putative ribonuclease H protein At1g65750 [Linum perenne]
MQTTFLPFSLCDKIYCKIRNFIWGSMPGARKIHSVNWDTMCKPKSLGGLGLRSAHDLNMALLMKVAWGLLARSDELWARVLVSKYLNRTDHGWVLKRKFGYLNLWRGVLKAWQNTLNGVRWSIMDGRGAKFWMDQWVDSRIVLIDYARNIQGIDVSCSVFYLCNFVGSWDRSRLSTSLTDESVLQVLGMKTPDP